MLLHPTISRAPESDPGLDQAQLFAEGLEYVRNLSGRLWSDHNTHDPGITILELVSYALTELSYRARFPLQDLLAIPTNSTENLAKQFFTAQQVLPNRALTTSDYRKLIIDLPGVKNAWISPAPLRYFADTVKATLLVDDPHQPGIRPVDVRGLFRVRIEYMDGADTESVNDSVRALLHENRNLCEDFVDIESVKPEWYSLCAELELTPDADPSLVEAQLRFEVERYLTPPVYNYTLAEMLEKRHADGSAYTVQEIFEGPQLEHGFIDTAELTRSELRTEIRLSDIISVMMDIEGVRAVRDIVVNVLDADNEPIVPGNKWLLLVTEGRQPRLSDPRLQGRLVFYKRNMPVSSDRTQVKSHLQSFDDTLRSRLERSGKEDLPIPVGRYRDVADYYSFQNHFPIVYGLSDVGLPNNVGAPRRAQALQLNAYLLFFDQIMANFLSQLSHVGDLFSREPAQPATYFAQAVRSFRNYERIYAEGINDSQLSDLLENPAAALERRSRFLNHLLARVAEDFHHYISIVSSSFPASIQSAIARKCEFLQRYPREGGERGLAYNRTLTAPEKRWNSDNISGLERRLARLLDIPNVSRRDLAAVSYDDHTELETTPTNEHRFRIKHPESGAILLRGSNLFVTPDAARAQMEYTIGLAQQRSSYVLTTAANDRHSFHIIDENGEVLARPDQDFATSAEVESAIDDLTDHLRNYYSGEGMYLVENILLRRHAEGDRLLPICVDPNCRDCVDDDPYSYRLHIILPAYAGRFRNMDFRRFVEETIRLEMPAHILPKVCWVDVEDMAAIEKAYRDWLPVQADLTAEVRPKALDALITALFTAKNVYPKQNLHDCASGDDKPPFILGRTPLGSGS